MNKRKLNSHGSLHIAALLLVVALVSIFGVYKLVASKASTLPPEVRPSIKVGHIHDSGRYDSPISRVIRDAGKQHSAASIITRTELQTTSRYNQLARAVRGSGWDIARTAGFGDGETSVEWDKRRWSRTGSIVTSQLTSARYKSTSGSYTPYFKTSRVRLAWAGAAKIRVSVFTVHMPQRNTERRVKVWDAAMSGLVAIVNKTKKAYPHDVIIVTGDWNCDWRTTAERSRLASFARATGLKNTWQYGGLPSRGGTYESTLIDMSFVSATINSAGLWYETDASDHRAFSEGLTL